MALHQKLVQSSSDRAMSKNHNGPVLLPPRSFFSRDAMHSFHYRLPPSLDDAPGPPLLCVHEDPSWYFEIYIRYPLDSTVIGIGLVLLPKRW
jgi:hypothetical protein